MEAIMRRAMSFLLGAAVGGFVGAALTLILTPASGEDLLKQMQDQADRIKAEVQNAAKERRAELEKQLVALRQPQRSEARIEIPD
jgi:gas vesicle protein